MSPTELRAPVARSRDRNGGASPTARYLVLFGAAALAAGLGRGITTTYLPVLLDRIESEPGLIGTALLVNAGAGFLVPLVVGRWSDRRQGGRRMPFIVGGTALTAAGLGAVALGNATSFLLLTAFGAAVYVGLNALTTGHRALIPDCFDHRDRARATSAQEIAMLAGSLVGVGAGGALIAVGGWAPFAFAAASVPLFAAPTVLGVRERGRRPALEAVEEAAPGSRLGEAARYYARSAGRPGVRALLGAQILWVLAYAAMPSFFILYADRELGLEPAAASPLLVGFGILSGASMLVAGRVRDRDRQKPLLALGVTAMAVGFGGLSFASALETAIPGLAAAALGFGMISTLGFPLFTTLIPDEEEGGYTALFYSVRSIASAIALPLAGWAISLSGSFRALFVLGALAALAALIPLSLVPGGADGGLERLRGRIAATPVPSRRWWARGVGIVTGTFAAVVAIGLLIPVTPLESLDESLFRRINSLGPGGELVWDALNPHTRNYVIITAIALALAAARAVKLILPVGLVLLLADLIGIGVLEVSYAIWDRPRPEEVLDPATIAVRGSWDHIESYPSGHMIVTTALAIGTAQAFPRLRPLAWAYVAAIGVSRIVFGSHFPLDVLAGTVVGYVAARAGFALVARLWPVPEWCARLRAPHRGVETG